MKKISILSIVSAALISGSAFAGSDCSGCSYDKKDVASNKSGSDIVATAASNEDFSTLVAAVKAAGLVETLQAEGPYTVFAPTNEAFAKLPEGTVESLLKPENKDQLAAILTYHVVPGKVMAADVKPGEVPTAQGQTAEISVADGSVMIENATIVMTDIQTSNGVIHVIDTVIIPEMPKEG